MAVLLWSECWRSKASYYIRRSMRREVERSAIIVFRWERLLPAFSEDIRYAKKEISKHPLLSQQQVRPSASVSARFHGCS